MLGMRIPYIHTTDETRPRTSSADVTCASRAARPAAGPDPAGGQVTALRAATNDQAQLLAEMTTLRDVGSDAMADDVVTTHEQSGVHVQR
jgi:hypothetical protein